MVINYLYDNQHCPELDTRRIPPDHRKRFGEKKKIGTFGSKKPGRRWSNCPFHIATRRTERTAAPDKALTM